MTLVDEHSMTQNILSKIYGIDLQLIPSKVNGPWFEQSL